MAGSLEELTRDQVWERIQRSDAFVVVDALSPMSFAAAHLPGAVNIPPPWVDDRARELIPDRDTPVVVYCASPACDSSVRVAGRLLELGYSDVAHYAGGKSDWLAGGLPLEGGRASLQR